ncbi:signal transduction histidine kinase regulating citrate/malate metabolism (plasmid) [Ilyobacter polytropus DSM 2926]|uniref:histidine kinase n=2 Tax=Ilyobacter TaxID=167639 RepID=E3HBY7_ILYPC|nr:signal transduction histidine kinase regulating citrate/malate metabolism [Ilyobacter polytropus DSM 2926]
MIKKSDIKIRNIFIVSMVAILIGPFYITPFNTNFYLTLLPIFLSLFLICFKNDNVVVISMSLGLSTFLFRSIVFYLSNEVPLENVFTQYTPLLVYYLSFGILFQKLKVRQILDNPFNAFLSIWACDSISNVIEVSTRQIWRVVDFSTILSKIMLVGAIRTSIILFIYYLIRYLLIKFQKSERDKYYHESIMFISKLKTELFFLKKSRDNIEDMVAYVHHYYEVTEDEKLKTPFLKIAKDIHEIKKDYLRVIAGMDTIFHSDTNIKYMTNKDILNIVADNALKLIKSKDKNIALSVHYDQIFLTNDFYSIISILNNLTINSIDSIESFGEIDIEMTFKDEEIEITVVDTGEGIPEDKMEVIFKSGYTTKYDAETGKMSTGLGLSHVHNIVTESFNGVIKVESKIKKGTKMIIDIPKETLMRGGETDDNNLYSR